MNPCEIVRDLLPLYIEDMTSQGSGEFIRDHLTHCPRCREVHQRMVAPTPPPTAQGEEWKIALQKAEKKEKRRKIFVWILAILVLLSIGASHLKDYLALHQVTSHSTTPIAPEEILTLCPAAVPTEEELEFLTLCSTLPIVTDTDRSISPEEFAPYADGLIPADAQIGDISGRKYSLTIDYFLGEQRILLGYRDENEDGIFDTLEKYVNPHHFTSDTSLYYSATYSASTVTTRYEMTQDLP